MNNHAKKRRSKLPNFVEGHAPNLQPYAGSPIIPTAPGHWILHDRGTARDRLLRTPLVGWMRCVPDPSGNNHGPLMLAAVSSDHELFAVEFISIELPDGTVNDGLKTYPTLTHWINRRFGSAAKGAQQKRRAKNAA